MRVFLMPAGLAVSVAALMTAAVGQTPPERTTATYGDWTLVCEIGEGSAGRVCEIGHTVTVQGQPGPTAQIALSPRAEGGSRLVVQVPLAVWLPGDVRLSAGEEEIVSAEYKRCFPQFCLAEAEVPEAMLEQLRERSGEGTLAFQDGAQRDVTVPFSFAGLADAYAALVAELTDAPESD